MATRGRKEWSNVGSLLWLAGIFVVLWGPRPASADGSAMKETTETTESWANWVQDKVTEGLGMRHENERMASEKIKDAAGNAARKISNAASDTVKDATLTGQQIRDAVIKNKNAFLNSFNDGSSDQDEDSRMNPKLEEAEVNAMPKAEAVKDNIKDGANMAAGKAEKAYKGAKEKVKETYQSAKDTMTESAKANYEAAKEKASQATGDLGAMMQQKTAGEL